MGYVIVCKGCGGRFQFTWGLDEPDHLSNWLNSEHCPHQLCRLKYNEWKQHMAFAESRLPS